MYCRNPFTGLIEHSDPRMLLYGVLLSHLPSPGHIGLSHQDIDVHILVLLCKYLDKCAVQKKLKVHEDFNFIHSSLLNRLTTDHFNVLSYNALKKAPTSSYISTVILLISPTGYFTFS